VRHPFLRTLAGASAVATDPNFENVTLLLHGDGTNGGQNNTFVDGSTNNFTITRNGNTTQGTFSPYGDNWSNYFDGTDDYLSLGPGAAFNFGTGNFTVEAWVFPAAQGNSGQGGFYFIDGRNSGQTNVWAFATNLNDAAGKAFQLDWFDGSTVMTTTSNLTQNTWNHVVYSRSGTTGSLFLNGVRAGTRTDSVNYNVSPTTSYVGSRYTNAYRLIGYLSSVRVVKGTAVYDPTQTTLTVPTAPLTAITNTSLLTCQSNRFRDASTNNFTITRNGDVSVQRFSPFSPTAAYAAGTIGGSGYFDGTGDNLSISSATGLCDFAAGQAFTFQVWLYRLGTGSMLFIQGGANTFQVFVGSSTGGWGYGKAGVADVLTGAGAAPIGAWSHCTICRDTSNRSRIWVNGVSVASSTSDTYSYNTAATYIGSNNTSNSSFVQGYLSDLRILKGQALYDPTSSANIDVPTAPLSAVTNTSFLLNFTNAAILDNAMMAVPETVGNAQIDTTIKKFGTGSLEFDGTGDWLLVPDSIDQRLGTGNFTIECWLYLSATGAARGIVGKGTSTTGWLLSTNSSNAVVFTYGTSTITSTGTLSGTTWYHIAVVREGTGSNQTKIYIGGTNDGTGTVSTDFTQTNAAYVGANRTAGDALNGYIDDLRITKGVARYTANFTPPTAAFPDL
jgi:hypothetical protein